jgi:hypothetical protein
MTELTIYEKNGFATREDYLDSLREDYGDDAVNALISILPPSEDFDGLITSLEDIADVHKRWGIAPPPRLLISL